MAMGTATFESEYKARVEDFLGLNYPERKREWLDRDEGFQYCTLRASAPTLDIVHAYVTGLKRSTGHWRERCPSPPIGVRGVRR